MESQLGNSKAALLHAGVLVLTSLVIILRFGGCRRGTSQQNFPGTLFRPAP
jgi:hypothetical protein